MKKLDVRRATRPLSQYTRDSAEGPVILTRHGVPFAALIAIKNADAETLSLSGNPQFLSIIGRSRRRIRREGALSPEQVRRRLNGGR